MYHLSIVLLQNKRKYSPFLNALNLNNNNDYDNKLLSYSSLISNRYHDSNNE